MSRRLDLSLYLVTDTAQCGPRGVAEVAAAAVDGGVTAVQVRDPLATGRELYALATAVRYRLRGTGIPLFVNDRLDVALAVGADGVHVGQSDLPVPEARRLAGPDLLIGLSVSRLAELDEVAGWPAGTVDYLGVGPVYATATKSTGPPLGLSGVRELCAAANLPCVAISGIDLTTAGRVIEAGADGIAVVSALCTAADPRAAAAELLAAMRGRSR